MRQEGLIWILFFMCVACASIAKNTDVLAVELPDPSVSMPRLKMQFSASAAAGIQPLPEHLKRLEVVPEPVGCTNIKGHSHIAMVLQDNEDDGRTLGGLYALTSKDGSRWDRTVRVYSSNSYAHPSAPAIACDTNEELRGHKNGFRNRIYLVWVLSSTPQSSSQYSQIFFATSADGGNTFGVPPLDGNSKWQYHPLRLDIGTEPASAPTVAVDEDGEVVVTWTETDSGSGATKKLTRRSNSGGAAFLQETSD